MLKISDVEPSTALDGLFTDGNVAGGISPTRLVAAWFNALQTELVNVVESSGMELDPDDSTQVLQALTKMFLSRSNPFADIAADGSEAIAQALANLRLGAGAPAIGIPFFWPSSAMPNTVMTEWADMVFLKFNGATFSAATYPKLALVIPSLTLVDARGEFPRIWDDGRGVDSGRSLLSAQGDAIRNITGEIYPNDGAASNIWLGVSPSYSGAFQPASTTSIIKNLSSLPSTESGRGGIRINAGNVVPTAAENRPRNIAFNFLVRAK